MITTTRRARVTLRRLSAAALLAAGLAAGSAAVAAPALADPAVDVSVNDQQALEAAQQALEGASVRSVELEMADGTPSWEVELVTRDGSEYEVEVDAATSMVVSIERAAG